MKKLFTKIGISIIAVVVVLLLAEIIIRLFVDKSRYQYYQVTDTWTPDEILGWRNKPYYIRENYLFGNLVRFATNVDGLRPANVVREKQPGIKRVLMIGNSTVASRAVREEESLHHYLDSLLNLNGRQFEVINAAVDGYATDQSYLHLHRLITQYQPEYVTYGFCDNDLFANLRKKDAGQFKPNFEPVQIGYELKLPEKNLEIQVLGSRYIENKILPNSTLYGYFRPAIYKLKVMMSGEQKQVEEVDPSVYLNREKYQIEFNLFSFLVSEMNNLCKANNAKFFFLRTS